MIFAFILVFLLPSALCEPGPEGILTESMKRGVVKLGKDCMKSVGASQKEMEALRGTPPYEGKTSCVLACILDKTGIMSNKKYSKKGLVYAITPFLLSDLHKMSRMREIANNCDKEIKKDEDECKAANHIVACLRENIPQISEIKFH